jgi:tetratricopeptide (TPR) repeat protein
VPRRLSAYRWPNARLIPSAEPRLSRAQAAEDIGDRAEAERLYRGLMKSDPTDAAPPFNLGNMLRADGRKVEAEAAFRAATRADPMFAEAWYNLSDLLDEQGRSEAAIDCLRRALHAAPEYLDAMFNIALLLQRSNRQPVSGWGVAKKGLWRRAGLGPPSLEDRGAAAPVDSEQFRCAQGPAIRSVVS